MQQDTSPAEKAVAVVPHDTNGLTTPARALYIGVGGNLVVTLIGQSSPVTFVGVLAGTILPVAARSVLLTGTTAASIVALA